MYVQKKTIRDYDVNAFLDVAEKETSYDEVPIKRFVMLYMTPTPRTPLVLPKALRM
jgi:hypothetical protein